MDLIKLMALDSEDLDVLASHMQDAVAKAKDLSYDARTHQFALTANRFVWETAGGRRRGFERRLAAMHFDRVMAVRSRGFDRTESERVLSLLTVQFFPDAIEGSPGGEIELIFSDDASIQLQVECIEVQLSDLGPAWETRHKPRHPDTA
ncbi:DUF2948 family protein [Pararhizobium haloflavum]|uniref:DUF2948 family protein n=1 Tax=Pararhizobium haloflavum TaxID=2037914 RepID=UPI000C19888A|nr:DUF2948 family protein [Pararhizobium haloflavum]